MLLIMPTRVHTAWLSGAAATRKHGPSVSRPVLLVLFSICLLAGCRSGDPREKAKQKFSTENTCPVQRVTVSPVEGVTMPDLMRGPDTIISEEIRRDPERLAMWQQDNAHKFDFFARYQLFHVEGCGHEADYGCHCPKFTDPGRKQISGGGTMADMCVCIPPPYSVSDLKKARAQRP